MLGKAESMTSEPEMPASEETEEQDESDIIHAAIQRAIATGDAEEFRDGAVVTKWVCVVEVMDAVEGEKWLTGYRGPTNNAIPVWDTKGLLAYAHEEMNFGDEEDD